MTVRDEELRDMSGAVGRLAELRVIAVLRAHSADAAVRTAEALALGGVRAVEVTYTTPDAPSVIARLGAAFGGELLLGAGTVLRAEDAEAAVEAGAQFLACPSYDEQTVAAIRRLPAAGIVGAWTPTEVRQAVTSGADVVKLFPANVGGPAHLTALRGPFPDLRVIPTGGVTAGNAAQWLAAGALAVGSSWMCPADVIARGEWAEITRRSQDVLAAVDAAVAS
ncbi:bifunctional 4-hydroxy-2-oxoglutarate aldolase/2-dehydro-3-deoxy-phosphogluconate aldolase [Streptomyces sp. ME03-5709C]|nr:bifunctional 4-hydroxy-2-oxoglutarate aldolase/2-dehydro-3-deoxy-phosphogluconate aldolase [Streptomyces sp. ME03-5709C]